MIRIFALILLLSGHMYAEELADDPFKGRQGKVVEKTDWPGDFTRIVAVAYDYSQDTADSVVIDKRLHKGVFAVSKALSEEQIVELYASITGKHTPWRSFLCYEPHHGFIFYDKNDAIIGSLSICFGCRGYNALPPGNLSGHWDLAGIKKLLEEVNIPFPDNYTTSYNEYKKANKAEMATPRKPSD